ncbi:hypothetical protein JCM1393_00930 [Clostridium carnis]
MITGIIYFFVIIIANTVGAISGMGGGVIIKPVMDALGIHSIAAISFYSSVAVFTMSIVSTLRQLKNKLTLNIKMAILVSIGSVLGGIVGNYTFEQFLYFFKNEQKVQIIQILITIITLVFALLYTKYKWKSLNLKNLMWYILIGIFFRIYINFTRDRRRTY